MRLVTLLSAAALLLAPLVAVPWSVVAQPTPNVWIVDPETNGTFEREDSVTVEVYSTWPSARVRIQMAGLPLGNATVPAGNGTTRMVIPTLVPENVTSGRYVLSAYLDEGPVSYVRHQPVQYVGGPAPNQPPVVRVDAASYDWSREETRVSGTASDPDGGPVTVVVRTPAGIETLSGVDGAWAATFAGAPVKSGTATASDGRNATTVAFNVTVPPMPTMARFPSGVLERGANATLEYRTASGARSVAALVELDGAEIATLLRPMGGAGWQRLNFTVPPDAPLGPASLTARVWTERDAAVSAQRDVEVDHASPLLRVEGTSYDPTTSMFRIVGTARDDNATLTLTLASNVSNATWTITPGPFVVEAPAVVPPGFYPASLALSDGHKSTVAAITLRALDHGPRIVITGARYVRGFGFEVDGTAEDFDHGDRVSSVTATTRWGSASGNVTNGTFHVGIPAVPRELGNTSLEVSARGVWGAAGSANATVRVTGVHRVFFDEALNISWGAHAELDQVYVAPRTVQGYVALSGRVVVSFSSDDGTRQVCAVSCTFATARGTWMDIGWLQPMAVDDGRARVRISGWEV